MSFQSSFTKYDNLRKNNTILKLKTNQLYFVNWLFFRLSLLSLNSKLFKIVFLPFDKK